jgi:hypothetical protein
MFCLLSPFFESEKLALMRLSSHSIFLKTAKWLDTLMMDFLLSSPSVAVV